MAEKEGFRYNMLVITGPTASGKTSLAAEMAFLLGGEVISADSRQVYRGMNIGTGKEVTIRELAETVKRIVGYDGEIYWNKDMPDGTPRKLTNVDKLRVV